MEKLKLTYLTSVRSDLKRVGRFSRGWTAWFLRSI